MGDAKHKILIVDDEENIRLLFKELAKRGIVNLLIEGGASTFTCALNEGLVDRAALFYAPIILGGSDRYSAVSGKGARRVMDAVRFKNVRYTRFGDDMLFEGEVLR